MDIQLRRGFDEQGEGRAGEARVPGLAIQLPVLFTVTVSDPPFSLALLFYGRTVTSSMPLAFGSRFFAYCFAVESFQWSATPPPALAALSM